MQKIIISALVMVVAIGITVIVYLGKQLLLKDGERGNSLWFHIGKKSIEIYTEKKAGEDHTTVVNVYKHS